MIVRPTVRACMVLVVAGVLGWLAFRSHQPALIAIPGLAIGACIAGLVAVFWPAKKREVTWHDPGIGVEGSFLAVRVDVGVDGEARIASSSPLLGDTWRELEQGHVTVMLNEPRRGVVTLGPIRVRRRDPFGMFVRYSTIATATDVIIGPQSVPVSALDTGALGDETERSRAGLGDVPDLIPREYRPGDPVRRILWRTSAKHGSLMVRQDAPHIAPVTEIVVDTMCGSDEAMDAVARVFASLCLAFAAAGHDVRVCETGVQQLRGLDASDERSVLHASALMTPEDRASDAHPRAQAIVVAATPSERALGIIAALPAGSTVLAQGSVSAPDGVHVADLPEYTADSHQSSRFAPA